VSKEQLHFLVHTLLSHEWSWIMYKTYLDWLKLEYTENEIAAAVEATFYTIKESRWGIVERKEPLPVLCGCCLTVLKGYSTPTGQIVPGCINCRKRNQYGVAHYKLQALHRFLNLSDRSFTLWLTRNLKVL
jgi:hypothetical protein